MAAESQPVPQDCSWTTDQGLAQAGLPRRPTQPLLLRGGPQLFTAHDAAWDTCPPEVSNRRLADHHRDPKRVTPAHSDRRPHLR